MQNDKRLSKPLIITAIIALLVIISIGLAALGGLFHKNPYGPATEIDNFRRYLPELSVDTYDAITAELYKTIKNNISDQSTPPTNGALIRDNTFTSQYNELASVSSSSFIVDIASIKQSYTINLEWSNEKNSTYGGGILILCPKTSELIYQATPNCIDMINVNPVNNIIEKYPILGKLPLNISEYENNNTKYINYSITYELSDLNEEERIYEHVTLIITDRTGGNRERALELIRSEGGNPNDFTIEYNNISNDYQTKPAGRPRH